MSRRNVWLSFSEWELISKELSEEKRHSFQLSSLQVKAWKSRMKEYSCYDSYKFERVGVYPEIEKVKSPRAVNVLCRENWRGQDMHSVMRMPYDFIGFIVNHVTNVDMDTPFEKWEEIRNQMKDRIDKSDKNIWWDNELIDLYKEVECSN